MKNFILAFLGLISISFAGNPVYYALDDFLQGAGRNPNKCVSKGATYKCVGYKDVEGVIFNNNTKRHYVYIRENRSESYIEFQCDSFFVEKTEDVEKIICGKSYALEEMACNSSFNLVRVYDYDELGILVDEKSAYDVDVALCRNAFHYQYGNDSGKPYKEIANLKKAPPKSKFESEIDAVLRDVAELQTTGAQIYGSERHSREDYSENGSEETGEKREEIGDGLAGLLGGGGGGIATKAKGSIKTPSARDIDMDSGGGSRSSADIMKVVRQRTPGLRHIYNKYIKKKPGFQGQVKLRFTIAPGGEIISISIASSTTGYKDFDNEIKAAVSRWKFSVVKSGNSTVTIPFTFSE